MAKLKYEVSAKRVGKDDKVFWTRIGVVLEGDKGLSLKLESVPVGWDGWATLFEPKDKGTRAPASRPADTRPAPPTDDDDDVPF